MQAKVTKAKENGGQKAKTTKAKNINLSAKRMYPVLKLIFQPFVKRIYSGRNTRLSSCE